jgi:hypothetical protein
MEKEAGRRSWLKHGFAVRAFFADSLVLTYSVEPESIRGLLPAGMRLDEAHGRAFMAAAFVQTKHLRPAGWPRWLGRDFLLAGYRVFVRFQAGSRDLRGLLILGSATDRRSMVRLGNLFTRYRYDYADISMTHEADCLRIRQRSAQRTELDVQADLAASGPSLPPGTVFPDSRRALKFAGPLPFTFTPYRGQVLVVGSQRAQWTPRLVPVTIHEDAAIRRRLGVPATLAAAFHVTNVPYQWRSGRLFEVPA